MTTSLIVAAVFGGIFAVGVIVLAAYRKHLANQEFDTIHIAAGEESLVPKQEALAARLTKIDRWGISLTVVLAVYVLTIAVIYCMRVWQTTGKLAGQ